MSLTPGTTLGPYEIVAALGAGGMGQVYRARDPRLRRDVAIKVLTEQFATDRDFLARFEREARSASALNHPNIITIHAIDQEDSVPYIVMELVEGESLRSPLAGGPLPLRRTLQIAAQIADGLAAAHDAGIVHRDLKPDNLLLAKSGVVKILDFGLAKQVASIAAGAEGGTLTEPLTVAGALMGTVGYMSPEQASGQPVDFRSDQFSFGLILYEMLSGRRTFKRNSLAETLAAIINDDPEPLPAPVPAPLRWLVERCLAKDPNERYGCTRDLARDLRTLRDRFTETTGATGVVAVAPRRRLWRALSVLVALLALGSVLFLERQRWQQPLPEFQRLTFRQGYVSSARFTPGGTMVVYGAAWDGGPITLYSTQTNGRESTPLALPNADILAISSAGEMAISRDRRFFEGWVTKGTLAQASLSGGAPRDLRTAVEDADWAPDGKALALARLDQGHARLEYPVDSVLYETDGWISDVRVSPRGDLVAFINHPVYGDDMGTVMVVDRTGKKQALTADWESAQGLAWRPAGDEIWFTASDSGNGSALRAVTLSGRQRLVARVPGRLRIQDIAADGKLLVTREAVRARISAMPPGATTERDLSWLDYSVAKDLSEDGTMLLFSEQGEGAGHGYGVYMRGTDGSPAVRLGDGNALALSPDGRWALSVHRDPPQLALLPTGVGEARLLPQDNIHGYQFAASWFPDGKRVVFAGNELGRGVRLFVQSVDGGKPEPITPEGVTAFLGDLISRDGKLVAALNATRRITLYPVDGGTPRELTSLDGEDTPACWSADGASLYAYKRGEVPAKVYRVDLTTDRKELWREISPLDSAGVLTIHVVHIGADGQAYAYSYLRVLSELYLVDGLH